jgi:hypothetical protein
LTRVCPNDLIVYLLHSVVRTPLWRKDSSYFLIILFF